MGRKPRPTLEQYQRLEEMWEQLSDAFNSLQREVYELFPVSSEVSKHVARMERSAMYRLRSHLENAVFADGMADQMGHRNRFPFAFTRFAISTEEEQG